MIKVLQVTAALSEGGVETLLHTFYECMDRDRFHFDIACYSNADGVYRTLFEKMGCGIVALPSKKHVLRSCAALRKALKDGKYDIVHVHQDDLSFLPILAAKLEHVPVRIVHSHLGRYPHSFLRKMVTGITNPMLFRLANGYFACSEKAKKEFYPGRLQEQVYIMENGIPSERFRYSESERNALRAEYGITEEQIVVGNVARIAAQKDPLFLVEVVRQLYAVNRRYRLMWVGDGVMRDAVEEKLNQYGLREAAILTGSRNDAWRFYNALDIFALPSAYEGLGISFVEAQTNGLPTFASTAVPRETKISPYIEYLPTGSGDAETWARKILCCELNEDRESAVTDDRYDIEVHAKDLEKEYIRLTEAQA